MKNLSDEQLERIGKKLSESLSLWIEICKESEKGLKKNSPQRRSIDQAKSKMETAHMRMKDLAFERLDQGWSHDKVSKVFSVRQTTSSSFS